MSTLYRQYRPQSFAEVFGQNPIKITLSEEIKRGQVASAYLFCGPRAVGKTTIARLLAKSLNCLNRKKDSAEPCNKCANCQAIMAGQSLDIIEIDAASQTGVDNVRENIIASSRIAASNGHYKVFIIDEVHMLSNSSFNALLKTLEEPPKQVVFILCTTEVHKIPATVISRCERYDFKKISPSDMVKKLQHILKQEGWVAEEAVLTAIAKNSQGHLRDAESLLGQLLAVSQPAKKAEKKLTMEDFYLLSPSSDMAMIGQFIKALGEQNSLEAISLINKLVADGRDMRVFLQDLIEILRQMLLSKINPQLLPEYQIQWGSDDAFGLAEWREKLAVNRLVQFLQSFLQAYNETKEAFIIQLPVELAVVRVLQPATEPTPRIISRPAPVATPLEAVPVAPTSTSEPTPVS
ncbi:MAG TPA: DNA polymerase III subunit gamma/tau, partial [bacterium]|nr:DNA polymerase III subunit gamma/tau [bacterium]